jgi:hypothetical protein
MDKILYCDKCYAYWPKVHSQKEIDTLRGQIATLKAICIKERDRRMGCERETIEQLAQEYPEIFAEETK